MRDTMLSDPIHVFALMKGIAESPGWNGRGPTQYFGSCFGWRTFVSDAIRCGLLMYVDDRESLYSLRLTDRGHEFYNRFLKDLPTRGRYNWWPEDGLREAREHLRGLYEASGRVDFVADAGDGTEVEIIDSDAGDGTETEVY